MIISKRSISVLAFALLGLFGGIIKADSFYKEVMLIGGYSKNDKWIGTKGEQKNSVGFEYFKTFSNEYGDFLTADFQVWTGYN